MVETASEVLSVMGRLLEAHGDCERVDVYMGRTKLFSVDRDGQKLHPNSAAGPGVQIRGRAS